MALQERGGALAATYQLLPGRFFSPAYLWHFCAASQTDLASAPSRHYNTVCCALRLLPCFLTLQ